MPDAAMFIPLFAAIDDDTPFYDYLRLARRDMPRMPLRATRAGAARLMPAFDSGAIAAMPRRAPTARRGARRAMPPAPDAARSMLPPPSASLPLRHAERQRYAAPLPVLRRRCLRATRLPDAMPFVAMPTRTPKCGAMS
jgi:hypothetical protein